MHLEHRSTGGASALPHAALAHASAATGWAAAAVFLGIAAPAGLQSARWGPGRPPAGKPLALEHESCSRGKRKKRWLSENANHLFFFFPFEAPAPFTERPLSSEHWYIIRAACGPAALAKFPPADFDALRGWHEDQILARVRWCLDTAHPAYHHPG